MRKIAGHGSLVLSLLATACQPSADQATEEGRGSQDGVESLEAHASSDLVRHARHFTLEQRDAYTVVRTFGEVAAFQTDGDDAQRVEDVVVLVPRGARPRQLPDDLEGAHVVEVPVRTIGVNGDDLLALVTELGVTDRLVAVGGRFTYDDSVRARVETGDLGELGYSWHLPPNMEVLLTRAPDATFLAMNSPDNVPSLERIRDLGLGAVPTFVWAERDPLARAEWIKFFGAFVGLEDEAEETFSEIEARYRELSERAAAVVDTPTVMWGYHAGDDRWFMMTNNLEAHLLRDAGAKNPLQNFEGGARYDGEEYSSEGLLVAGAETEHWLIGDIHGGDLPPGRYMQEFRAWRDGRLYHNYARSNWDVNAYDWYESAVARPDVALADVVHLLHPALLSDHELVYLGHFDREAGR